MTLRKPTRFLSVLLSMLAIVSLIPAQPALAASGISVTPSTQALQPGQTFTVQIRGNVASSGYLGVNEVTGVLTFPSNLLQATSFNTSSATLNWQKSESIGNGVVNFEQRSFLPVNNTDIFVGTVTFRALANGSASVGFSTGTTFGHNGVPTSTTRSGGTYTISTPPPATCPAGQVGTPPNCTTPQPSQCPAGQTGTPPNCRTATCPSGQTGIPPNCKTVSNPTPAQPTPPSTTQKPQEPSAPIPTPEVSQDATPDNGFSISEATATRGYTSATLNWKTTSASKATIGYGTSLKELNKTVDGTKLPDETYEARIADLTPGKQYYYTITATSDTDSSKTDSYSGVFTARGYPVSITVTENKTQAANAKVKIGEQNYSTDKAGRLSLELASGSYTIEARTQGNNSKSFSLAVAKKSIPENGNAPETQKFAFDIPAAAAPSSSNNLLLMVGGLGVGGLLIAGLLFWLWRRRRQQDSPAPTAIVATDNDYNWSQPATQTFTPDQYTPTPPPPPIPEQTFAEPPMPPNEPEYTAQGTATMDDSMPIDQQVAALTPEPLPTDDGQGIQESVQAPQQDTYVQEEVAETIGQEYTDQPSPTEAQPEIENYASPESVEQPPELAEATPPIEASYDEPPAQIVETASGSELQINHTGSSERHNSVYMDDEEPKDMFETAQNNERTP